VCVSIGKQWKAQIYYGSKQHYLGTFETKQEAALAYDREARQCGKDKPLNYKSINAAEEAAVQAQAVHPKQPKPRPTSGFYGVSANKKRWEANINYDSTQHYLGTFETKQEAALAYDREARQCGEDKLLNYESIKAAEEAVAEAQVTQRAESNEAKKLSPIAAICLQVAIVGKWCRQIYMTPKYQLCGHICLNWYFTEEEGGWLGPLSGAPTGAFNGLIFDFCLTYFRAVELPAGQHPAVPYT
jgi:hypothetical protein